MERPATPKKVAECCPPEQSERALPSDEAGADARLARLAKALAHPARVAILRLLLKRRTCMCGEIVDVLPLAQSTVSQHLRQLKEAGLIRGEVDGPRVCYCVDEGVLAQLEALLGQLSASRPPTAISSDEQAEEAPCSATP
jgi:DNA-binding transcriptional ArsR family regulator